ncbi:TonB-dependent receptor [Massilia sp.]|uniref:TonB-dependent receptor n=1 Tax=Massilia sp. TaxID=1882437 RepID=UPI002899BDD3|nr:TonB-dependent receptor [Massilia sp.]
MTDRSGKRVLQRHWAALGAVGLCAPALAQTGFGEPAASREATVLVSAQRESVPGASRLGLTPRETPATIEVVGADTIRDQGYNTFIDTVKSAAGVTAADTAQHLPFTMRGFQDAQVNVTYNGINPGSNGFTGMNMGTFNLERVEFLKGPSSIMSGQGAVGGSVNFVTKAPHTGQVSNELLVGGDERGSLRTGFGSGGSTNVTGLDYRIDLSRSNERSFIEDSQVEYRHFSGQLDYRVSPGLKLFVAAERKDLDGEVYEGTPLVPLAFSGAFSTDDIVRGTRISSYNGSDLGAVTIDRRTLKTNYNVLDDSKTIDETWLRAGLDWQLAAGVALRSQFYRYDAERRWHNNEVIAFNADTGLVDRERFYVAHDQDIRGNNTELSWNSRVAGLDNRFVAALEYYDTDFVRPGAANYPSDSVSLLAPARGNYGLLTTTPQRARIESTALNLEDRVKLSSNVALVGGLRYNRFRVNRQSLDAAGASRAGFPLAQKWDPVTGRIGFTWDTSRNVTLYGQYATASDVSVGSYFMLSPTQRMELSKARSYEAGIKGSFLDRRLDAAMAIFDIQRRNVYSAAANQRMNSAGKLDSRGVEVSATLRPAAGWNLWGNASYVHARYDNYELTGQSFSRHTPPNIPSVIVNGGASYRMRTAVPLELGASFSRLGKRFTTDENTVTMQGYTTADVYAFIDLPAGAFTALGDTRLTLRVKNVGNTRYAAYGDPFYPDQVFLGAPRTAEASVSFKF